MENRIVLGFPYAGAFLWLLNAEQQYKKSIKEQYPGGHPYYVSLFGRNHNLIIDETVSLSLLFDEIYLSPVDAYLPDYHKYTVGQAYSNQEWGIYSNWDWLQNINELHKEIDFLLKDSFIIGYLNNVSVEAKSHLLREAINQIYVSDKFETAIFAIPTYLELCKRVNELLLISRNGVKVQSSFATSKAISTVFDLSTLHFSINGLEEFAMLRQENNVKKYAQSFRSYVTELPSGDLDDSLLYKAMLEAINKDSIADKISGSLGLTSTITSFVSLIPGIGTIASAVGIGADSASRVAKNQSDKNKWWLIAPEISKQLTKKRIEALFNEKQR